MKHYSNQSLDVLQKIGTRLPKKLALELMERRWVNTALSDRSSEAIGHAFNDNRYR